MLKPLDIPLGMIRPVDPVERHRKPDNLGYRPSRKQRRKPPKEHQNTETVVEEQRVDDYA